MGWHFELKHANTVAYLTVPSLKNPPRLTSWELREFLGSIQGEYREHPPVFSSDPNWVEKIVAIAREASRYHEAKEFRNESILPLEYTATVLHRLRSEFGFYALYGLAVGTWQDRDELEAFTRYAAYSSRHEGLFLLPDFPGSEATVGMFDPSPIARQILTKPDRWPGMLFWLPSGTSSFAPLTEAERLYQDALVALRSPHDRTGRLERILDEYNATYEKQPRKRILHLSDLHFGTQQALENQTYLYTHLATRKNDFERVVITGDLFDNPKQNDALAFQNFHRSLEALIHSEVIVVPGNHDQKLKGNSALGLGVNLSEIARLDRSSIEIDHDMKCIFYCFNSSIEAKNFARGHVSRNQMIALSTNFNTKLAANQNIRDYLSVALIHHHPYSFRTHTETHLQRGLRAIGMDDEKFLCMDNADEFLKWCAGRRIPLILHGHKHEQRHVNERILWNNGAEPEYRNVTAVGCGTSLGAEGLPLTYNILEWSPHSAKWSASFFRDPGNGSGFDEIYVALHSVAN